MYYFTRLEHRRSERLNGVSEISLFTSLGEKLCEARIKNMSESGMLVADLPPEVQVLPGHRIPFRFVLPTGEVSGLAEVVRVRPADHEVALRLVKIDDEGLPNFLYFLDSWFRGLV